MAKKRDQSDMIALRLKPDQKRKIEAGAAAVGLNRSAFLKACVWAVLGSDAGGKRKP